MKKLYILALVGLFAGAADAKSCPIAKAEYDKCAAECAVYAQKVANGEIIIGDEDEEMGDIYNRCIMEKCHAKYKRACCLEACKNGDKSAKCKKKCEKIRVD